eukprot:TRINITY_DN38152_c0_g1_i1.p2 TRINITY_DN38152_c0_g1~~TRINITY_DN38152_c0_g1_i1.p2  ORF type:complete len:136 (+),score=39.98 TRINITY_DN38152_c0_g1_i1:59-409(+)
MMRLFAAPLRAYTTAAAGAAATEPGVVVSFVGRYPLVRLDSGPTVTVMQKNPPFVMAQQRLVLQSQSGEEQSAQADGSANWHIVSVEKRSSTVSSVFGDGSNALWNNKFAKNARKK